MTSIYHNNRCGKSRSALQLLEEKGETINVVEYLKTPPSAKEIEGLLSLLGYKAHDLIRTKEAVYLENYKGKTLTEKEWIQAMVDHPILIERPIVIKNGKAVVARPPEKLLEIL